MPIQNHFRKVTKMIIHIKDIVEVTTCCAKVTAAFPINLIALRSDYGLIVLANSGNGGRSCVLLLPKR